MQINYDSKGNMYKLPLSVINDPISYSNLSIIENKKPKDIKVLKLKIRSIKDQSEVAIEIQDDKLVKELKDQYSKNLNLMNSKIRIMSKGKELTDENPLYYYDLENEIVLIAQVIKL